MKTVYPSYMPAFRCVAEKCRHNCCVGWEIDIDEKALGKYRTVSGDMGKRLRENITICDGCACFTLGKDESCPFLNNDGLCDIIITLGENYLCNICADHPRFRSFFSGRTEIGLGLCCEEAARIILNQSDRVYLVEDGTGEEDEDEKFLLQTREEIIDLLQSRELGIDERLKAVEKKYSLECIHSIDIKELYISLEVLDSSWLDLIAGIPDAEELVLPANAGLPFEQLAVYFIYRHLPQVLYGVPLREAIGFCLLSTYLIGTLCRLGADLEDTARMYSSEIEYSDENPEIIMKKISSLL